jgi:hypothetical protein
MKWPLLVLCVVVPLSAPSLGAAQDRGPDNKANKDQAKKSEPTLTPQLEAWKRQVESWPTDRLRQEIALEKKSLEEWARKNNFNPPGDQHDGDKNRVARKGNRRTRVVIGKRQEAELMAQFLPRKARVDVMESVLRERENPRKDRAEKKEK